jgi:hypothetical protein
MSTSEIRALLEDGPRAGEVLSVAPGPDGQAPPQLVVSDPLAEGRQEGNSDLGGPTRRATTYHSHGLDEGRNLFVYRTGRPD